MQIDTSRFEFLAAALHGEGGFRPKVATVNGAPVVVGPNYLVRYPRESDEKFARRAEVAWYVNDLYSACERFAGYIAKRPPSRELPNPLLEALAADSNWCGDSLDVFLAEFIIDAKARGLMAILVDMPRALPADQATQVAERAFPYLVPIAPECIAEIELTERGLVKRIEFRSGNGDEVRGWDAADWWVRDGETESERQPHDLGLCPVLLFAEKKFPHAGNFAQIADLSRRLFNLTSERDEILRAQTFSLLAYPVPPEMSAMFDASQVTEAIGTNNMLIHYGDAPAFIAPPEGPARTYLETIDQVQARIREIAMVTEHSPAQESGVALTLRFQALNSALTGFARKLEDLERRVWDVACAWLKIKNTTVVSWPKDYAIADVIAELDVLERFQGAGAPEPVIEAQMTAVVQAQFATAEPETLAGLTRSVSEMVHQRPADPAAADPAAPAPGDNP